MGETVLLVIVLLLALFGCTQLIRWIVLRQAQVNCWKTSTP